MRPHNYVRILAATATVVALAPPAASAVDIGQGGSGLPAVSHSVVATPRHSSSTDWTLIALAGGGTAVLIGAGLGGSHQIARRRNSTSPAGATRA
jgi:hypothetical protein